MLYQMYGMKIVSHLTISNAADFHLGNVQSQTKDSSGLMIQSAKVNTGFINCYAFGNGVESYRIRDSIKGPVF